MKKISLIEKGLSDIIVNIFTIALGLCHLLWYSDSLSIKVYNKGLGDLFLSLLSLLLETLVI
jgi:hypothetical protein